MSRARPPRRRGLLKKTLVIVLAGMIVLAGLLVGGVRLLDAFAPQYRNALAERIGQRIGADIQISGLALSWGWHGPVLYLDDLKVTRDGADAPVLTAQRLGLMFSVSDLLHGSRLPDGIQLEQPRLGFFEQPSGRPGLAHWSRPEDTPPTWQQINALHSQLKTIDIDGARIDIDSAKLPNDHLRLRNLSAHLRPQSDQSAQPAHWQIDLTANGPIWWPQVAMQARITGSLPQPNRATLAFHAQGLRPLVLASRHDWLPPRIAQRLSGGVASIDMHGLWQSDRLQSSRTTLSLTPTQDRQRRQPLLPALTAVVSAQSDAEARHIELNLKRLSSDDDALGRMQANARVDTRAQTLQASAHDLPGELAARLALLSRPKLADANVSLAIDDIELETGIDHPAQLAMGFHGLTIDDPHLSAGPVAGRYTQKDGIHHLSFNQASGELSAPRYLNGALTISDLGGGLSWQRQADGLHLDIDKLRLASQQATLTANGSVRMPDDGAPVVDLSADMSAPDIVRLLAHIPQASDLPNPRLRDWLPKAIRRGVLDSAHATIQGPIDRFPFAQPHPDEGFHLRLSGHDVDVAYKPDWPVLKQAAGTLELDGDTLDLALSSARMLDFGIDQAHAHVPDVREPVLHVTGQTHNTKAPRLLAFLTESPLRDRFGKLVNAIDLTGRDDLSVDLSIPLKPELGDIKVSGQVDAKGNTLAQDALPGPITAIHGQVRFNRQGLSAQGLRGQLLGVPITADLSPGDKHEQQITAHARPSLPDDRAALAHYLPAAWLDYGQGQSSLRVAFGISPQGQLSPITVDSPLQGMAINLPAPLAKPADTTAPLSVTVNPASNRVHARYDQRLRIDARLQDGHPNRLQVRLNDKQLPAPNRDGVWIGGQADQVDAIGWFNVVRHVLYDADRNTATPTDNQTENNHSLAFLGGDLHIGQLSFGDHFFPDTHVRAQPMAGVHGWRINLEGDATQGQFTWTDPADQRTTLAGNLKRLALTSHSAPPDNGPGNDRSKQPAEDDSPIIWPDLSPLNLPGMKLYVQQFVVDDTHFGQTHVDATPLPDGWRLDRFSLADGALTGRAQAQWQQSSGLTRAQASANFDGHGLARLLNSLGYVSPVRSKQAHIRSKLRITPNPNGLDLRNLDGNVHFTLDKGTLLSVEPGPGRLLGLFNFYVLPRRLRLDFRDVVDKGMAFDKARADFDIQNGQAYSDNLVIKTPSSNIGINGRVGLATRDYDEHVTISPKLGSGVAIASAVFGGPIVGAAVFAVQELLKKPIQQFSSIGYTLKGSWDDPQITDPSASH